MTDGQWIGAFVPDREQGGPLTTHDPHQLSVSHQSQDRGFLQKLKNLFWKPEEVEPKVEEKKTESTHKTN
jgi:hypothetical protein